MGTKLNELISKIDDELWYLEYPRNVLWRPKYTSASKGKDKQIIVTWIAQDKVVPRQIEKEILNVVEPYKNKFDKLKIIMGQRDTGVTMTKDVDFSIKSNFSELISRIDMFSSKSELVTFPGGKQNEFTVDNKDKIITYLGKIMRYLDKCEDNLSIDNVKNIRAMLNGLDKKLSKPRMTSIELDDRRRQMEFRLK